MNRFALAAAAALTLAGCYTDGEYVQGVSGGIAVTSAPPPLPYEAALACDGAVWVPGSWDWGGGGWAWRAGACMPYQAGYVYNPPYYVGGMYYRGYWGRPGAYYRGGYYGSGYNRGYVSPAPAYGVRSYGVAPAYGGRAYVAPPAPRVYSPAPVYRAPAPVYRAPAASGRVYIAPPRR